MKDFNINEFLCYAMFMNFVHKFKTLAYCNDIDLDLYFEDLDYICMYLSLLHDKQDFRLMNFHEINNFLEGQLYEK